MGSVAPDSPQSKTDVVAEFRRGQILSAARDRFGRQGLRGTTVADIARAAGVAKGTVYLYFRSKDELLRSVLTGDLAELHDETVPEISAPGSLEDKLRRFIRTELAFFDRHRDFIEQCHFEMAPDVRKQARGQLAAIYAAQTKAREGALASSPDARHDAVNAALGIVTLVHGLAIHRLRGWATDDLSTAVEWATSLIAKGLLRR
jgi:AcrR family transcriptional regulator